MLYGQRPWILLKGFLHEWTVVQTSDSWLIPLQYFTFQWKLLVTVLFFPADSWNGWRIFLNRTARTVPKAVDLFFEQIARAVTSNGRLEQIAQTVQMADKFFERIAQATNISQYWVTLQKIQLLSRSYICLLSSIITHPFNFWLILLATLRHVI